MRGPPRNLEAFCSTSGLLESRDGRPPNGSILQMQAENCHMKGTRARKICSSKNEEAPLGKLFKIAKHKWTSPQTVLANLQLAQLTNCMGGSLSDTGMVSMHRSCLTALQQPVHRRDPPPEKQEHTAQSHATSGPQPQRWRASVTRRPRMSGTREQGVRRVLSCQRVADGCSQNAHMQATLAALARVWRTCNWPSGALSETLRGSPGRTQATQRCKQRQMS